MPLVHVEQLEDPRLEPYRDIKKTNRTRWTGRFVAEGDKLVQRLLEAGWPLDSLLVSQAHVTRLAQLLPEQLPVYVVPDAIVEPLVGFNFHRGILACGQRPVDHSPEQLIDYLAVPEQPQLISVCLDVQDPENMGAIIRSSNAFGCRGVLVNDGGVDPFSRRVLRTSMGSVFQRPLVVSHDAERDLAWLKQQGFTIAGTVIDRDAIPLAQFEPPRRLALLFGNEGNGLSEIWRSFCDYRVTIPMSAQIDSLNVSVAAGIVLFHCATYQHSPAQ